MATHETAETQYITANGTRLAYRRLGLTTGTPLLLLIHFRGNMDFWDPLLINTLSQTRPILLLDIAGTGKSSGTVPKTMQEWASHAIAFCKALGLKEIDLLGFSMGGLAVQYIALDAPGLVRKLIVAGSRTSRIEETVIGDRKWFWPLATSESLRDFKQAWVDSFFPHTPQGVIEAEICWERIMLRSHDRAPPLSPKAAQNQIAAFASADRDPTRLEIKHAADRLSELTMPVFVVNGDDDLLIPTINSVRLAAALPDAHLHIYPNSGHGFLFQYAEVFARHVELFLDGPGRDDKARL